jgi:hypothetical protein
LRPVRVSHHSADRWHLDHADDGVGYLGASHARCNTRAAAIKTNKERAAALRAAKGTAEALLSNDNAFRAGGGRSREW